MLFIQKCQKKIMDITNSLTKLTDYKNYYLEDKHGGHFSAKGNKLVAELKKEDQLASLIDCNLIFLCNISSWM